jgi:hypothetical protein
VDLKQPLGGIQREKQLGEFAAYRKQSAVFTFVVVPCCFQAMEGMRSYASESHRQVLLPLLLLLLLLSCGQLCRDCRKGHGFDTSQGSRQLPTTPIRGLALDGHTSHLAQACATPLQPLPPPSGVRFRGISLVSKDPKARQPVAATVMLEVMVTVSDACACLHTGAAGRGNRRTPPQRAPRAAELALAAFIFAGRRHCPGPLL